MQGGYCVPYDASRALRRLELGEDMWSELWQELHHQGDLGEASYVALPHLVRIAKALPLRDWNFYGLLSVIEVERHRKSNPPLPHWLESSYASAWTNVLSIATEDLKTTNDKATMRAIIGAIALAKGDLKMGALITNSDDSEIDEMLEEYDAWSETHS